MIQSSESRLLPKRFLIIVTVGILLLLKIPSAHAADVTLSTPGITTVTIPAGVTALLVELWGAGGSGSGYDGTDKTPYAGGSGSYVHCQLAIAGPGPTTITVIVGQGGLAPAYGNPTTTGTNAIGGGGAGVADNHHSPGGGGGRSSIKNPSTPAADWVTAGGGGGGGIEVHCLLL